jgi:hypothetical protein
MNEQEQELFETELRRLELSQLPHELQARLQRLRQTEPLKEIRRPQAAFRERGAWAWLRWIAPATAAMLALFAVIWHLNRDTSTAPTHLASPNKAFKADHVEIDRELLDSIDTIQHTPDGEPVHFRINQWMEAVTLRDSTRGVEVIQRTPRIEVVPVSFGSY